MWQFFGKILKNLPQLCHFDPFFSLSGEFSPKEKTLVATS
jgi:hypothetical protein